MCLITYWIYSPNKRDPPSLGYAASELQSESGTHISEEKGLLGLHFLLPDLNLPSSPIFFHTLNLLLKRQTFKIFFPLNWSFWCQVILEPVISEYDKLPVAGLLLQVWSFDALVISIQENYKSEQHKLLHLQMEN